MDGPSLLSEHLRTNSLSLRAFAEKVEAPVALVWRWSKGKGTPGNAYALAVAAATGGDVPAESWLGEADAQLVRRIVRSRARSAPRRTSNGR